MQRIGFLGGSFDPVHLGHLMMVQDAYEGMALDRVWFVPAARNPHKSCGPRISDAWRVELLRATIGQRSWLGVDERELLRGGPSYTVETIRDLKREYSSARLFWILGGDNLPMLSSWYQFEELARLVEFIVVERPGYSFQGELNDVRIHRICGHPMDIQSREIRARLQAGKPVDIFLPAVVCKLIEENSLYTDTINGQRREE